MKCCSQCLGDMWHEISRGSAEWICLQCGPRQTTRLEKGSCQTPGDVRFDQALNRDLSPAGRQPEPVRR
jgi:hypothetical protein